jgi:hypothetical protein
MEITALTKIGALLDAHPELEEPLIAFVPAFAKLRNPILRATVAKLATLEHAAKMGEVPLPTLIAFLCQQLGQTPGPVATSSPTETAWPAWYRAEDVIAELDASALLASGRHPMHSVRQALSSERPGAIVVIKSDFEPAPLLDQMAKEGILAVCIKDGSTYRTCLRRP